MGRFLGRLGGHEGYAARKSGDGSVVDSRAGDGAAFATYVAACSCRGEPGRVDWWGPNEYPPTPEGEKAAVDEWEQLHARYLLTTPHQAEVSREVVSLLVRLEALTVQSPVAMLVELQRFERRSGELLAMAVGHSLATGMSWAGVAAALGMTEPAVRHLFEDRGP